MVLCRPNHLLRVLAKESSLLQIATGGRFELGIGAGDYPGEFAAWNVAFPDARTTSSGWAKAFRPCSASGRSNR